VIIRTNAEGKRVADLDAELKVLLKRWEDNIGKIQKAKGPLFDL
jgi:ribonuclease G